MSNVLRYVAVLDVQVGGAVMFISRNFGCHCGKGCIGRCALQSWLASIALILYYYTVDLIGSYYRFFGDLITSFCFRIDMKLFPAIHERPFLGKI
jgi:hypothetical protein